MRPPSNPGTRAHEQRMRAIPLTSPDTALHWQEPGARCPRGSATEQPCSPVQSSTGLRELDAFQGEHRAEGPSDEDVGFLRGRGGVGLRGLQALCLKAGAPDLPTRSLVLSPAPVEGHRHGAAGSGVGRCSLHSPPDPGCSPGPVMSLPSCALPLAGRPGSGPVGCCLPWKQ